MNKDNALLYIPFIQAIAEGKVIECNAHPDGGTWLPLPNPTFTWEPDHYRIKLPEPRTFYCYRHTSACENNMSRMFLSEKDRTDHLAFITISSANIELLIFGWRAEINEANFAIATQAGMGITYFLRYCRMPARVRARLDYMKARHNYGW